jgi:hypothetical protein
LKISPFTVTPVKAGVTELFEIKEKNMIEMHTGRPPALAPRGARTPAAEAMC